MTHCTFQAAPRWADMGTGGSHRLKPSPAALEEAGGAEDAEELPLPRLLLVSRRWRPTGAPLWFHCFAAAAAVQVPTPHTTPS